MKDSLKSQPGCGKLRGRSARRLRKEILGTGDKEVAISFIYTILESFLEFTRGKCGGSVTDGVQGMLARSGPDGLLVRNSVLFPSRLCPHREYIYVLFFVIFYYLLLVRSFYHY